jgi:glycosyltransferase involved in cell wall biosynthesis
MVHYSEGGIGQYTVRLVQALARVDRDDPFLLLQSRRDDRSLVNQPNFQRRDLWTPSHHRLEQWTLPLELAALDIDVLHSPDFIPPFHSQVGSVITIHDLAFLLYPQFLTPESARYYGQIDEAVHRADHIVAVSESTRDDIMQLLGVPGERITVIYEAANPLCRPMDREEVSISLEKHYGITDDYLLFVSTIEPRKNLPNLLRAFRQLVNRGREENLLVVGRKGWLFDEVMEVTECLHLSDRVRFMGQVEAEQLVLLYNGARALVYPSFYEGFGLPPLEAMACGTPAVVSNVSSLPEVVGDAALQVDPDDEDGIAEAMERILEDEELRGRLVQRGLERSRQFSWERAARETLQVYRGLVN